MCGIAGLLDPGWSRTQDDIEALAGRIREMPPAMLAYKGLTWVRAPLLAWLDQVAASGGGSAPIGLPTVSNGPSRPRSSSARASTQ